MEDNNKNNQNQFQMGINPEVAEGIYSNLALITHSSSDFILDFACALPGMPQPQIKSRVIMAPEHAKRLLQAFRVTYTIMSRHLARSRCLMSQSVQSLHSILLRVKHNLKQR